MNDQGFYLSFFDLMLLVPMTFAVWRGFRNGFIPEALTLAIFLLFVYLYIRMTDVPGLLWTRDVAKTLIYLPVFFFTFALFGIIFVSHLIENLVFKQVNKLEINSVGHLLGIGLAIVRYIFVISCILIIYDKLDEKYKLMTSIEKEGSYFYKPLLRVAPAFYPYLSFDNIRNTTYIDSVKHANLKYKKGEIPIGKSLEEIKGSEQGEIIWTSYKAENWETNNNLVVVEATVTNRDEKVYVTGVFKFLYNKRKNKVDLLEYIFNDVREDDMSAYTTMNRGRFPLATSTSK